MNMHSIRARREDGVTIGEVLAEARNLATTPAVSTFDADDSPNYFARSLEWALHPHKIVAGPWTRFTSGNGSVADDTCTAAGLLMHDLDDRSIADAAPANGDVAEHKTVYREVPKEATSPPVAGADGAGAEAGAGHIRRSRPVIQPRIFDKIEAFVSRLSMRDNFWNSVCSLLWLPLAFFSGIRMKELDANSFAARAVLPFRRFNRNWYRAMAGGALLANSEIAGGSYVFGICGADYTVVCKNLNYTFLRPCFGPAIYRMQPREDIKARLATKKEFNITIDMDITQQAARRGEKDKRVGKCEATFHVTPKVHHNQKRARRRDR